MSDKKRLRSPYCTNCGKVLQPHDNYCPNCGQENDNKRQSFGKVMYELLEGFISIDSRLANSLPALLFRPAFLTKEYLKGRRQRYLDPIRMFLSIMVLYFILASFSDNGFLSKNGDSLAATIAAAENNTTDTIIDIGEGPLKINLNQNSEPEVADDTTYLPEADTDLDIPEYQHIKALVKAGHNDTKEVLDSLQVENTFWNRFYYGEVIKFAKIDYDQFKDFLISKLPWIIFVLIPVFALLLKLLYIRRDYLYFDHLIFAFHLHSFLFILGVIYLVIQNLTGAELNGWMAILILTYTLLAFKNFYLQSWLKTISKIFILWFLYISTASISFFISLVVIFLIY